MTSSVLLFALVAGGGCGLFTGLAQAQAQAQVQTQAEAQARTKAQEGGARSRLWDGLRYPSEGRYHDLVSRAELALTHARGDESDDSARDGAGGDAPRGGKDGPGDGAPEAGRASPVTPAEGMKGVLARLKAAERMVREAIRLIPTRPQAWEVLGRLLGAMGRQGEAADAFAEALRLDVGARPRSLGYALAMASLRAGRYLVAAKTFESLARSEDPPRMAATLMNQRAVALVAAGRLHAAEALFEAAVTRDPRYAPPRWGLVVTAHHGDRPELARRRAVAALLVDPGARFLTSPQALFVPPASRHYYAALAAEAHRSPERALAAWQAFLREAPRSPWRIPAEAALARLRRSLGTLGPLRAARPGMAAGGGPAAGRPRSSSGASRPVPTGGTGRTP